MRLNGVGAAGEEGRGLRWDELLRAPFLAPRLLRRTCRDLGLHLHWLSSEGGEGTRSGSTPPCSRIGCLRVFVGWAALLSPVFRHNQQTAQLPFPPPLPQTPSSAPLLCPLWPPPFPHRPPSEQTAALFKNSFRFGGGGVAVATVRGGRRAVWDRNGTSGVAGGLVTVAIEEQTLTDFFVFVLPSLQA